MLLDLVVFLDPPKFVLEAISRAFRVDKRGEKSNNSNENDLGSACVLVLESLIPVMVDPVIGKSRLLVTPSVKANLEERREGGGCVGGGGGAVCM